MVFGGRDGFQKINFNKYYFFKLLYEILFHHVKTHLSSH
jgi:hypothetical protein